MNASAPQFGNINISRDKVLSRLGYAEGKTIIDAKTGRLVEGEILNAQKLIVPKQVIASSDIKKDKKGQILLEPGFAISSLDIAGLLENCEKAYGFAVSIGSFLEDRRDAYIKDGQTARALVLDAIGSVAAEELAELTHGQISRDAEKESLKTTRRFSPGYGDWPLEAQKDFLKWLGADMIGIRLTANFQMLPEKSVSAILGVKQF